MIFSITKLRKSKCFLSEVSNLSVVYIFMPLNIDLNILYIIENAWALLLPKETLSPILFFSVNRVNLFFLIVTLACGIFNL